MTGDGGGKPARYAFLAEDVAAGEAEGRLGGMVIGGEGGGGRYGRWREVGLAADWAVSAGGRGKGEWKDGKGREEEGGGGVILSFGCLWATGLGVGSNEASRGP